MRNKRTRSAAGVLAALAAPAAIWAAVGTASPAGAAGTPGVTRSAIRIGVTSIDLSSVTDLTHGLDQGDFQATYSALIDEVNEQGGIDGRKLVPTFVTINPLESSSSSAACTQLTEDDKVFAVIGEFYTDGPECFVADHATPVVGGTMTDAELARAKAPWVTATPNRDVVVPAAVAAAARAGVLKGKKVGLLIPSGLDPGVVAQVTKVLHQHGVTPKFTATTENDASDIEAILQQISGVLVPKLQAAGVEVVIAVGVASTLWVDATGSGTYHPQLVGTDYSDTTAAISGKSATTTSVAAHAVTMYTRPLAAGAKAIGWADPSLQRCARIDRAASVKFSNPVTTPPTSNDDSYIAVAQSCQVMTLFQAVLAKAGKNLTDTTFANAADTLGSVEVPGLGTTTYDKADPAGSFPLYLYRWDQAKKEWAVSARSYGNT